MKYKKKCSAYYLFMPFLLIICSIVSFSVAQEEAKEIVPFVYNVASVIQNLKIQKHISKSRLFILPALIVITAYYNKHKLISYVENYPIPFLAASYLLSNYVIDSISKYRQINQVLDFFLFSQTMSRYLLSIVAVKNTMKRLNIVKGIDFDEQHFLAIVSQNTGYTIEELEFFVFELLHSSVNSMSGLCVDINTTEIEEKIYFLFKEQITLEQMLLICKDDAMMYEHLHKFYVNPVQEYEKIMEMLCSLVRGSFNSFIKKKLHFK